MEKVYVILIRVRNLKLLRKIKKWTYFLLGSDF